MQIDVVLIVLRPVDCAADGRAYEHLGVAYLAAVLRAQGYTVRILDQNLSLQSLEEITATILQLCPAMVGITCYQDAYLPLQQFVRLLKLQQPEIHLTLGGVFATNSFRCILEELPELDSLVLGEGETTIAALADAVFGGQDWRTLPHLTFPGDPQMDDKSPSYDQDLNILPFAARDTLPLVMERGLYPLVLGSRGCYGQCTYCSITASHRFRRPREVDAVIDELEMLQQDYGADYVYCMDDTFMGGSQRDRERVERFAQTLLRRQVQVAFSFECRANEVDPALMRLLKTAGLRSVFLGIESGYQPTLELFRKGVTLAENEQAIKILRELGIPCNIGFIMFHPYTTLAEVKANLHFLLKTDQKTFLNGVKNRLLIFDNTPIAQQVKNDGFMQGQWYETIVPFVHAEIEPLYQFVQSFDQQLRPGITRLAWLHSQSQDLAEKQKLARVHGEICSLFTQTLLDYVEDPSPERLEMAWQRLSNIHQAGIPQLISG